MAQPTIRDVAELAGTSTAVVSYVLNDGPRPVSPSTRLKVEEAIRQLDYRPNRVARALRARETRTLGLVVPDIAAGFFAELAAAVQAATYDSRRQLLIADSAFSTRRESDQVEALLDARVDGIVMVPAHDGRLAQQRLTAAGVPHVFMHAGRRGVNSVMGDDVSAGYRATRHLVEEHGHTYVACLGARPRRSPVGRRVEGYAAAMAALRPEVDSAALTRWCDTTSLTQVAYDEARRLLDESPEVTAICAATDQHAWGVMRAAAEAGRTIGDDLALVSIDGTSLTAFCTPGVTVLRLPFEKMGREAVDLVLGDEHTGTVQHRLDYELVVRASCGCGRTDVSA